MIQIKPKKCKGTGRAAGYGCGLAQLQRKYGLGYSCRCYPNWLQNSIEGQEMIIKSSKKAKMYSTSSKQSKRLKEYNRLRLEFLNKNENQICPITGGKTTEIHHKKGRIGKLLNDTRYWIALSREGHIKVELNPKWAKEYGYSLSRLSDD